MLNYSLYPLPVYKNFANEQINKTLFFTNINDSITLGNLSNNCNSNTILAKANKNLHKLLLFIIFNTNYLHTSFEESSDYIKLNDLFLLFTFILDTLVEFV